MRGVRKTRSSIGADAPVERGRNGAKPDARLTKSLLSSGKRASDIEEEVSRGIGDFDSKRVSLKARSHRRTRSAEHGTCEESKTSTDDKKRDLSTCDHTNARKVPLRRGTARSKSADSFDFSQKLKGRGSKKPPKDTTTECVSPSKVTKVVPKLAPPPLKAGAVVRPARNVPELEMVPANETFSEQRLSQSNLCDVDDLDKHRTIHKTRKSRVKKVLSKEGSSMFTLPDEPKSTDVLDFDDVFDSFFLPDDTDLFKTSSPVSCDSSPVGAAEELRNLSLSSRSSEPDDVVAALVTTVRRQKSTSGRSRVAPKRTSSMSTSHHGGENQTNSLSVSHREVRI